MTIKLKLMRKFNPVRHTGGIDLVRREVPKPAVPLISVGDCMVCWKPLMVAPGQRIRFHKECRKEGRKKYGRADGVVEYDAHNNPIYKKPE